MSNQGNIITTARVQENARITNSVDGKPKTFSIDHRKEDTDRYWKEVDEIPRRRKIFPIEYWKLDNLIQRGGDIALIVKNIDNPHLVTAQWVSFLAAKPPKLAAKSLCFVLSKTFYKGVIANLDLGTVSHEIRGMEGCGYAVGVPNFMVALLGKDSHGKYVLYLQNAFATLIEEDPKGSFDTSPGGENAGGVRLP